MSLSEFLFALAGVVFAGGVALLLGWPDGRPECPRCGRRPGTTFVRNGLYHYTCHLCVTTWKA